MCSSRRSLGPPLGNGARKRLPPLVTGNQLSNEIWKRAVTSFDIPGTESATNERTKSMGSILLEKIILS
jgi:hypothetical protein